MTTELDIANAVAVGELPSGTEFMGSRFFALRFSGTGCAWRESVSEFCYRDPRIWLSLSMQRRVCGVPLIWDHPPDATLDGDELARRIIGVLVHGFVRGSELWSVGRVIDREAAALLDTGQFDTSPAIKIPKSEMRTLVVDGAPLLVEAEPSLLDHLCICGIGVWSKGAAAGGVDVNQERIAA